MNEVQNEALMCRSYEELWNAWRLDIADEILSPTMCFRGSLGSTARGREGFKAYVEQVRLAFPDWHNQIDELLAVVEPGSAFQPRARTRPLHGRPARTQMPNREATLVRPDQVVDVDVSPERDVIAEPK